VDGTSYCRHIPTRESKRKAMPGIAWLDTQTGQVEIVTCDNGCEPPAPRFLVSNRIDKAFRPSV